MTRSRSIALLDLLLKDPTFEPASSPAWESWTGTLDTYFETGMECLGLILYDETKKIPNPNAGVEGHPHKNIPYFCDWDGTHFLEAGDILDVLDENGAVVRRIPLIFDYEAAQANEYRRSFYAMGVDDKDWIPLFNKEHRARLWRKKPVTGP